MQNFRRLQKISLVSLIIGLGVLLIVTRQDVFFKLKQSKLEVKKAFPQLLSPVTIPVYVGSGPPNQNFPAASSSAIYVMDRASASILYQQNEQQIHYPASTIKMMTALVARKIYSLDQILPIKSEAFATGSTAHFVVGEEITVQNLLYALLLPSGNDAALVLANHHPQGYEGFVKEMNQTAQEIHLTNTVFQNPSGLDVDQQETTARDLAILANQLMKDSVLGQIVGTKQIIITDKTGKIKHNLVSTQELLGIIPGVVGIKTGTTTSAGENLITEVDRDGHQVIIVLLGSQNRYNETKAIIDWIFGQYQWRVVASESMP